MKMLLCLTVAVGALASPALTFAQTTAAPLSREQVRAELIRLEQAGYDPSAGENVHYPDNVQAAEAKAAGQSGTQDKRDDSVGGVAPATASGAGSAMRCVGPVEFCNLYFGS